MSDIDGSNITSLLLCFFVLFLRPLIDEGKVYKSLPPLYLLDKKSIRRFYKGNEWLFDKREYYDLFNSIIANNVEVELEDPETGNIQPLKKAELKQWLELNNEYLLELDSLVKRTACHPLILEYACWYKLMSLDDEYKFKKIIEEKFDELKYDMNDQSLYGSFEGNFISLIIDKLFMKISRRFMQHLANNPSFIIYCKNKNDANDDWDGMTIGTFLNLMQKKFDIKIQQRFKGLGEAEPELLFITTMNPKIRKLIRLSIEDIENTLGVFELLHGRTNALREQRRELLDNTKISYADIDN